MGDAANDFYLGKKYDLSARKMGDEPLFYDPSDLTTHAFVTGMTGSGKTGLCISMLEEAALKGLPAIIVDPKGDLTNLLLHFPQLLPTDFEPWIDPNEARRQGKDVSTMAAETAETWRKGLAGFNLGPENIQKLAESVEFNIYTPGSTSGEPVNILSSFNKSDLSWQENSELLRDKIASTVTALLGLIGYKDIDPLRSREHILLSNILETAWSQGKVLNMSDLIMQVQKPPFERLGAFPLDNFYPEKERFSLAILLNNFLASPSFQIWTQGSGLDVQSFLYTKDGKPKHSIFYIAHLSDSERMFFVTLLYSAIETWMFTQRGTSTLRALVYFDEVHGYLPPVANPPSKPLFIRLLKQARAFGIGLIMATQNPVDVDYKALSNAGTWMIGRLQTDQDKQRLLDGLSEVGGGNDRGAYDKMISALTKRVFLLHNVHDSAPSIFQTRFVMNYLAGPLTKSQIPQLMQLAGVKKSSGNATAAVPAQAGAIETQSTQPIRINPSAPQTFDANAYSETKPVTPSSLPEYFYPAELDLRSALQESGLPMPADAAIVYHPALLAQAEIRYYARQFGLDFSNKVAALIDDLQERSVRWEDFVWQAQDVRKLGRSPLPRASFAPIPGWLTDERRLKSMQADFADWIYRTAAVKARGNRALKIFVGPEVSEENFRRELQAAAEKALAGEAKKTVDAIDRKLDALELKVKRQALEVEQQEKQYNQRKMEELGAGGEFLMSLFTKRKRSISSNLSKRRMTSNAKSDLEQENQELNALQQQLKDLEAQKEQLAAEMKQRFDSVMNEVEELPLNPAKKDIFVDVFGLVWLPSYQYTVNGAQRETRAYKV